MNALMKEFCIQRITLERKTHPNSDERGWAVVRFEYGGADRATCEEAQQSHLWYMAADREWQPWVIGKSGKTLASVFYKRVKRRNENDCTTVAGDTRLLKKGISYKFLNRKTGEYEFGIVQDIEVYKQNAMPLAEVMIAYDLVIVRAWYTGRLYALKKDELIPDGSEEVVGETKKTQYVID